MIYSFPNIFSECKRSLRLSLPLIGSQLIYGLSGFAAMVMIAHLGRDELAANALVWSVFTFVLVTFIGILCAISVLVAQSYGAEDECGIRVAASQGLILAVLLTIPMMLVMWFAPYILIWSGQSQELIQFATPYFHALAYCILPCNLLIAVEQFLSGIEKTRLVLIISVAEVPLEIFFFYVLVFGKWGFPNCGMIGIAYGATLAMLIADIVVFVYLYSAKKFKRYLHFNWRIHKKYFLELLRIGIPMGGMMGIELALFTVIALLMGKLGNDTLAAYQIVYQCLVLVLTIIFGLSQGATVRVGYEVGAGNKNAVKVAAVTNFGLGFLYMLVIGVFYFVMPRQIISLAVNLSDPKMRDVILYATGFLAVVAVLQISDNFRLLGVAILRGLKDAKVPMYISIVAFWLVSFPCAYLLGFKYKFGGVGIWWGLTVGLMAAAVMLQWRFQWLIKRVRFSELITK